jgi:hypothetical protein
MHRRPRERPRQRETVGDRHEVWITGLGVPLPARRATVRERVALWLLRQRRFHIVRSQRRSEMDKPMIHDTYEAPHDSTGAYPEPVHAGDEPRADLGEDEETTHKRARLFARWLDGFR